MELCLKLAFLVVILCLPEKSYSTGHCYDIKGKPVPFGRVYYDGDSCKTCRREEKAVQSHTMELMEEKWRTLFKIFDSNHNGMITNDDFEINKDSFIKVYKLSGAEEEKVRTTLDKFWHCVVLHTHKSHLKISEDKFLARYRKAYMTHKAHAVKRMQGCNSHLLNVIDRNKDGFLSFDELSDDFKAWNQGNEQLVREVFKIMGTNTNNLVPYENFDNFYVEFPFGENKEHFENIKKIYRTAGFPV